MGVSIYRKSGMSMVWLCPYIWQKAIMDGESKAFTSYKSWHARIKDEGNAK